MKGKTKLIFMRICTFLMGCILGASICNHNMFGVWWSLAFLVLFYPWHIWSALVRMKHENKEQKP